MPVNTVPGVYLSETLNPPPAPTGALSVSLAAIVGPNPRGPVSAATLVSSFQDFTNQFGGFVPGTAATDLQYAAYLFFNNGGRDLYVVRATDGNEVTATIGLLDSEPTAAGPPATPRTTLVVNAANPGTWGNQIAVQVTVDTADPTRFSLAVFYNGTAVGNVVERFSSLTMDTTDSRYAPAIINNPAVGSAYITVTDSLVPTTVSLTQRTPATAGSPVSLATGADASGAPSSTRFDVALALLDAIPGPLNINLPGETSATLINKALTYATTRGNAFVVIDGLTAASTSAQQVTRTALYTATSYGATYFPRVVIADPASRAVGATRVTAPGGAVLGIYAKTDATSSIAKAPAGLNASVRGAIALEITLADADLLALQIGYTNAIRNLPGAGVVLMGARTMTTAGAIDKYVSARRTLIYIKAQLQQILQFSLFENNGSLLRQQAFNLTDRFLREMWSSRVLRGGSEQEAYFVVCDDTNNTATTVANGELRVKVGVALQTPAEFIVIEVGQFDGVISAVEVA